MTMNEYLLEPFLTQYYLLEAICSHFITEKAKTKVFFELARIFCIPESEELKNYYEDSNMSHFKEIRNLASYERFCRTVEFAQSSGQDIGITERDRMILAQKREAMQIFSELFKQAKNLTKETVFSTLLAMAMNGNVDAMMTLAYMEYHGICVCKDRHNALKRIRLCAKWNNLFGNLLGIAYDTENGEEYYDILYTILRNASHQQIFLHICKTNDHSGKCKKNGTSRILEKAFGLGIVRRNTYDSVFAKIAFSALISLEDKEKILLNKKKEAILSLSDIPFDASFEKKLEFDEKCSDEIPISRKNETKRILQNIAVAKNCPSEAYTPLLIVASDEYVTDMYVKMLKNGFSGSSVSEIDAGTLTAQDFAGGSENVFLRGLSETKSANTVFILKHCEELESKPLEELLKALDHEYRKKFKLFQPPVSIDLSGLVFILFASRRTTDVMKISECCDTVWTERINAREKISVVESVFRSRSVSFGCADLTMEVGCKEFLAEYSTKQVQQIVDSALRCAVFDKSASITLSSIKAICEEQNITVLKRGFGYAGGDNYA